VPDSLGDSAGRPFDRDSHPDFAHLRLTVERAPVGIAHFAVDGHFLFVNSQLCTVFGFTREELLGLTFQEISFAGDLERCLTMTKRLAAGTIAKYTMDKRFVRRDGTPVYTRVIVSAVRDADGKVEYFLGIVEDLSEQWAIEEARRATEERLHVALDASATGIYRYDFRAMALDWANNLGRVFGFSDGDRLRSRDQLLAVIHPDDLEQVLAAYARSATDGSDFDQEFRIFFPDGSIRWIADRARVTRDTNGAPAYLTGACTDVTKRHEAEAERERLLEREHAALAEAERAIRLRDDVLAIVAHDLRDPVHTIVMSAAAMIELELPEEQRRQQLDIIRRSGRSMDHLIRDLLDVTRIEMGGLTVHLSRVRLAQVIDEVVVAFDAQVRQRALSIDADTSSQLPDVFADRDRIAQVLNNLIGNAMKFTPPHGRISVRARSVEDNVEVSVVDTGVGISPDDLARVFDRYWQADRGARQGVGLGLTIVRGIIDAHGGRIEANSRRGEGTTFRFTLPAGPAAVELQE
jgi:PAS domain S-box-containing protein